MTIQWFPGHMAKARREVTEQLKMVDVVFELVDARIPLSSRNPMIDDIVKQKPRVVILNKKICQNKVRQINGRNTLKSRLFPVQIDSKHGKHLGELMKAAQAATKEKFDRENVKVFVREQLEQ